MSTSKSTSPNFSLVAPLKARLVSASDVRNENKSQKLISLFRLLGTPIKRDDERCSAL